MAGLVRRKGFLSIVLILLLILAALAAGFVVFAHKNEVESASDFDTVRIFAAASTSNAVAEIARKYEEKQNVQVELNFAASSTLARQIEQGAMADVYLSANLDWMDYLQARKLIHADSRIDLLSNRLVFIAPAESELEIGPSDISRLKYMFNGRISIGDPEHVPAGRYAKQALIHYGWYDSLQSMLVPCADVRTALRLVEMGEVHAGIVYKTDALITDRVKIIDTFPKQSHDSILYPAACVGEVTTQGLDMLNYLQSNEAVSIFEKYGFVFLSEKNSSRFQASDKEWSRLLQREELEALWLSVKVAVSCVLLVSIPGIALGYLLARYDFPGKSLLNALVHVPLVMPPVVTGYLLLLVLGRNGVLGSYLAGRFGIQISFTVAAAAIAAAVLSLPLMVRSVRLAVELVDHKLEQAAGSLGAGPVRQFLTITLPLALPGVLGGAVLAFARSLGEFGATITFAGNIPGRTQTIPLAIFSAVQQPGGESPAMRLVLLSIALSIGALLVSEIFNRRILLRRS